MKLISKVLKFVSPQYVLTVLACLVFGAAQAISPPPVSGLDLYAKVDGIGSLVDARSGGSCGAIGNFGCTRDEIILFGDGFTRSGGLFQVLKDPFYCNSVTLTGLPVQGAVLLAKSWSERFPTDSAHQFSRAYETYSGTATIPLPTNTDWSTIAVVSQSALPNGSQQTIRATCNPALAASAVSVVYNVAGGLGRVFLVDTVSNYSTWTGNGSLISTSGNYATGDSAAGYGRNRDVVGEFGDGRYSAQYFQVYSNGGSCNSVRISSNGGNPAYRIRSKAWDAPNWITRVSNTTNLPITMTVSTNGFNSGYNLINVEMLDNSSRTQITVTCI